MIAKALLLSLLALTLPAAVAHASDDGYADAMMHEHAHESPAASPAAAPAPAAPVQSARVDYATVDGKPVQGYLAKPQQGPAGAPGIIVIHEWWGLNENVEAMARQLAGEGYMALAVNLYGDKAATTPEEARNLMIATQGKQASLDENVRQAYAYLEKQGAKKIGVIGWCFGGGWSLRTALLLPDKIDATVIYYGRLETDPEKLKPLQMPIIGFFGALDGGIPVDSVRQFEKTLQGLGKSVEIHVYEGAEHAFANPSGERYKKEAAEDAWTKTLAFFAKHLK